MNQTFPVEELYGASGMCYTPGSGYTQQAPNASAVYSAPGDAGIFSSTCSDVAPVHFIAPLKEKTVGLNKGGMGGAPSVNNVALLTGPTAYGPANLGATASLRAPAMRYDGATSVTVSAWVRRGGGVAPDLTPLLVLGNGLVLSAASLGATGFSVCVTGAPSSAPSGNGAMCSAYTGAPTLSPTPVSVVPKDASNGWAHVMFHAVNDNSYYLYVDGALAADASSANLTAFTAYYDSSPRALGVAQPWWRQANVMFGDVQVYVNLTDPQGVFLGVPCNSPVEMTLNSTIPGALYALPYVDASNSSIQSFAQFTSGGAWIPASGSLAANTAGMGWALGNGSVLTFAQANYGLFFDYENIDESLKPGGITFVFWLYSGVHGPDGVTQLLTVPADEGSAYSVSVSVATAPYFVAVTWPGCMLGMRFFDARGVLNSTGIHMVTVSYTTRNLAVYVDGEMAANTMGLDDPSTCTADTASWPTDLTTSPTLGNTLSGTSSFSLVHFAVYDHVVLPSQIQAAWQTGGIRGMLTGGAAPPPPYVGSFAPNAAKLSACETRPPIHRYGSAGPYPFRGGLLRDFGSDGGWDVPWRSQSVAQLPADNSLVQMNASGGIASVAAFVDFGTRKFDPRQDGASPGLTIGFMANSAPCANITAVDYAPSSMAFFDVGGYSMYSVGPECTFPGATTYLTSPSGSSVALTGTFDRPVPLAQNRYVFVTFGTRGAVVYINGRRWKSSPVVLWSYASSTFVATRMRFFGGNLLSTTITIHDLQIYDYELSAGRVAGLSRGLGHIC